MQTLKPYDMFYAMLELQYAANCKLADPNWVKLPDRFKFASAIRDECVEADVSAGWLPWWRKEESVYNVNNLHLELVDIFHFHMSLLMQEIYADTGHDVYRESLLSGAKPEECSNKLMTHIILQSATHLSVAQECSLTLNVKYDINSYLGVLLHQGAQHSAIPFFKMTQAYKLPLSRLYQYYLAKNALNMYRAELGYKDDKSVKYWSVVDGNPVEDNHYVMESIRNCEIKSFDDMLSYIRGLHSMVIGKHTRV